MLNRRSFAGLMTSALGAAALDTHILAAQSQRMSGVPADRLSVMIWTLRDHGTLEQSLESVAKAGYRHVELIAEFKKWSEAEMVRFLAHIKALGITVDATTGMTLGFADPAGGDAYLAELRSVIPTLQRIGCPQLILVSGRRIGTAAPEAQHQASIETLKRAADILHAANIVGLMEPIDRIENPPIYLDGVTEAFEICKAVGSPNIKVLYDLYHEQRGYGNLIEKLEKNIADVALIHVADVPGRHQPGTGEINFGNIYKKLAELNYKGMICMEFYPVGEAVETLRRARTEISAYWPKA